jgi:hypothetical protein
MQQLCYYGKLFCIEKDLKIQLDMFLKLCIKDCNKLMVVYLASLHQSNTDTSFLLRLRLEMPPYIR